LIFQNQSGWTISVAPQEPAADRQPGKERADPRADGMDIRTHGLRQFFKS
jgi:hypothetical protein